MRLGLQCQDLRMKKPHLPLWLMLLVGSMMATVLAWSRDGFVESIFSEYRKYDQASRADTTRDGLITDAEFAYNLYSQADAQGNNDNQVSRDEFLDYYTQNYNVSSELATLMFDYLNDPSNGDDVIKVNDVSLTSFSGRKFATVNEYRSGLEKWIRQSADKLYTILMSPHTIDARSEPEIRYNAIVDSIDTNKDNVLTLSELNEELQRIGSNAQVRRRDWVWRNTQRYGADPVTANLVFDYWDRDGDHFLTSRDLQYMTEDMDLNVDNKVGVDEFVRFVERGYKLSRRMTGAPLSTTMAVCPDPWWSDLGWTANVDATRAAMDLDDDLNGWITMSDLTRWLNIFDDDNDGSISRREYANIQAQRYGVNATIASAMFDLVDTTGDDKLDSLDWEQHFKGDFSVSFCDAKRSIQDLVRMAERFRGLRQGREMREAMSKRLQEELTYYRQNKDRQSSGRSDTFDRGVGSSRCAGKVTCYQGESTEAWWEGEAWLWWSVKITDQRLGPGTPSIDAFRPVDGGYPSVPVISSSMGRGMNSPINIGEPPAHPYPSHQWPPMFDMGNMAHMGELGHFQPYKRSTDKQLNLKSGQINRSSNGNSPYFSDYQRLYSPYSQSSQAPTANPINSDSDVYTDNLDANKGTPEDAAAVTMNNGAQSSNGPRSSFHDVGDRQQNETPAATKKVDDRKKGGKGAFDDELPPFPVIGYPVLLGFDPWMMNGGAPNWGMFGRRKREESAEEEVSRARRDVSEENKETSAGKDGEKRGENVRASGQDEDSNGASNSSDPVDNIMGWGPGLMMAPPPGFALTPWDLWMAWSLESVLWDAMHPNQWNSTSDNSSSTGNDTKDDEAWEEMMRWAARQSEDASDQESGGENDRRQIFNQLNDQATENNEEELQDRDKRFIQDSNMFSWPAYWSNWIRSSPSFGNYWPPFRNFGDIGWRGPGFGYASPWERWMRYRNFNWNFPINRFDFSHRARRSSNEANIENANEDAERDLRSDTTDTSRREFSFDKWKDSTREPSKNPKMTSDEKKDSIWRSSTSKYGTENDWQQQLNSGSSQWNLGTKEQYGAQRWSNGKLSTSLQEGQQGDWLKSLFSSTRGDWKKPLGTQSFGGQFDSAFLQPPTNFASPSVFRNIVPRTMLASFIPQKPTSWPGWGGYIDELNSFEPRSLNKFTNPSQWSDFTDFFSNFFPNGYDEDFANWPSGTAGLNGPEDFMNFWNNRFVRGTGSKNSKTEESSSGQADNVEGSREKRNADDSARNKRWDFSGFRSPFLYRQSMPNWVSWFYPWCQQWSQDRFPRDAKEKSGGTDEDEDLEKRSSQAESDKGKRWGYGYMDRQAPGYSNYNYNSMYSNWAWVCPQVWRAIQSYNNPWSFYAGGASSPYQVLRIKRDVTASDKEKTPQADDESRSKRWEGEEWDWFGNDEDCNYPMPAWTPWRGWNMLRSARDGGLKGPLTAENIKASVPRSPPVKKGIRCRSWYKKYNNNNADFGYGNQNRWSGEGNQWGDESSWDHGRFGGDNKNTAGSSWRTKRGTEAERSKRQGTWGNLQYPFFGYPFYGQWWNPSFFYYNPPWRGQWYNGFNGFPGNYMRRLRQAAGAGVEPAEGERAKRDATEKDDEATRDKRNLWPRWGGYPNSWWGNRFTPPWSPSSQFSSQYHSNNWVNSRQRREANVEDKDDERDKRSFPWNAGPDFGNFWMNSHSRQFPWWFYRYGNQYDATRFPRETGGDENVSDSGASKNKRWIGSQWPYGWPSNTWYPTEPWSTRWDAQPYPFWYGSMRWPRSAPENTEETRSKRSASSDDQGKQLQDRSLFNDFQSKQWPAQSLFNSDQGNKWQESNPFNDAQRKQWQDPNAIPRTSKSLWNGFNNYGGYWNRFINGYPFSSQPQFRQWGFPNWYPPLPNTWPLKRSTRSTAESIDGVLQEDNGVTKRWVQYPWWRSYSRDWDYDPTWSHYPGFASAWNPHRFSNVYTWPRFARRSEDDKASNREKRSADDDSKEKRWAGYSWNQWPNNWQWSPYEDWFGSRWGGGFYSAMRFPRGSKASGQTNDERSKRQTGDTDRSKRWPSWDTFGHWQGRYSPFWNNEQYPHDWWGYNFENAFRYPRNLKEGNVDETPRDKRAAVEEKLLVDDDKNADQNDNRTKRWWSEGDTFPWSNRWQYWPRRTPFDWTPQSAWGDYNYNYRYPRQAEGQNAELSDKGDDATRLKRWNNWPWSWGHQTWSPNSWVSNGWYFSNWGNSDFLRYGRETSESDGEHRKKREAETDRSKRWPNPWSGAMWDPQSSWNWNWDSSFYPDFPYSNRFGSRFWRRETDDKKDDGVDKRTKREADEDSGRQKRWLNWYNYFSPYWTNSWGSRGMFSFPWYNPQFWDPRFLNRFVVRRAASESGNDTEEVAGTDEDQTRTRRWQNWNGYPFYNWPNFGSGGGAPWWSGSGMYGWGPRYNNMMYGWNPWYNNVYDFNRYQRDSDVSDDETAEEGSRKKRDAENDVSRDKRWFGGSNAFGGYWNGYWGNQFNRFEPWSGGHEWWRGDWDSLRYPRDNKDEDGERNKRSADVEQKNKRWGEWASGGGDWMSWYFNRNQPPFSGNYNFWNGVNNPSAFFNSGRFKRNSEETARDKRWYNEFYYPYWNNGYNTFMNSWDSWPRFFGDRFSRQTASTEKSEENVRVKRYQPWVFPLSGYNAFPQGFSGIWGQTPGMSSSNWYSPYRTSGFRNYFQRWNPWYRDYFWNVRRSPRRTETGEAEANSDKQQEESGIAPDESSREKRWAGDVDGSSPWNRGGSFPWSHRPGNSWYNNPGFGGSSSPYWNQFSNFYPWRPIRGTDNGKARNIARNKREANPELDRSKRWYGNSPAFYNWNSQGWPIWDPYRHRGSQWYSNPWRFSQAYSKRSPTEEEGGLRSKRGIDEDSREKRWWQHDPQGYNSMYFYNYRNWGDSQPAYTPWSFNYPVSRVKRNPGLHQDRDKRWGWDNSFISGSSNYNWNFGQTRPYWNFWNPSGDWGGYSNYMMRWPRDLDKDKEKGVVKDDNDDAIEQGTDNDGVRRKRDAEGGDREKRWGDYITSPYSNYFWKDGYWGSQPWTFTQRWTDFMRYPRKTSGSEDTSAAEKGEKVTDSVGDQDNPIAERTKRWGNWNAPPYGGPGFPNSLRNLLYRTRFQSGAPNYGQWSWWNRSYPYK